MKRKILSFVFALCLLLPCAFIMTACGTPTHTHTWSNFIGDDYGHWIECTECHEKKTEESHKYFFNCDAECFVCGHIRRDVSHNYLWSDWESDNYEHWHICIDCGETFDNDSHKYDHNCDTECKICHTHNIYAECSAEPTLRYDAKNHWEVCKWCSKIIEYSTQPHYFDNDCDSTCNNCGYTRTVNHNYITERWDYDDNIHYHRCEDCSNKTDVAKHSLTQKADEHGHYQKCSVCLATIGYEYHTWDNQCDTTCNDCGYVRIIEHNYQTKYNDSQHWQECEYCHDKKDYTNHTYDNACDTTCNDCENVRTVPAHTYANTYVPSATGHWHECSICGAVQEESIQEHNYVAGVCTLCGDIEGLVFRLCSYYQNGNRYYYYEVENGKNVTATSITIPSVYNDGENGTYPVECIDGNAFSDNQNITELVIPDSVESIFTYAFAGCKNLTSVTIGDGVKEISLCAFDSCTKLKTLTFGNSLETIGQLAFGMTGIESLIIPNSVTKIESQAFWMCESLQNLVLGNSVETIGYEAFRDAKITTLTIPKSVTSIGGGAFRGTKITTLTIPANVKTIGDDAFSCTDLNSLVIENGVKSIGSYAFYLLKKLKYLVIPDSVETIGDCAFYKCENLLSVTIGSGMSKIGNNAFKDCIRLVEVINHSALPLVKGKNVAEHALVLKTSGTSNIDNINGYLFVSCDNKNYFIDYAGTDVLLTLPQSYNGQSYEVWNYAFYGDKIIVSIDFGEGVTYIGDDLFDGGEKLQSVTIGKNVTGIAETAFSGAAAIEVINYSSLDISLSTLNQNGYVQDGALNVKTEGTSDIVIKDDYVFYSFGGVNYLLCYVGTSKDLILPESYNGQSYEIWKSAFSYQDIKSVIISENVSKIGSSAFRGCTYLETVIIKGDYTEIVSNDVFYGCDALTKYEANGGLYIGNENNHYAYLIQVGLNVSTISYSIKEGCRVISGDFFIRWQELSSITIPAGVTIIGDRAFYNCSSLTNVTLPNSLVKIGNYAFWNTGLTSIHIPANVASFGENNPFSAKNLTSITVDSKNTKCCVVDGCLIEMDTHRLVSGINKNGGIKIAESVTSIGKYAFYDCTNITYVIFPESLTIIYSDAFYECDDNIIAYDMRTSWSSLPDIEVGNIGSINPNSHRYHFYSETERSGRWHYDTDGITPVLW